MAKRVNEKKQSVHDQAVYAAANIYKNKGKSVAINPGSEKNKSWSDQYIDVIADFDDKGAWVIEIETQDSVSQEEVAQWKKYDKAFTNWHLAVPVESKRNAMMLLKSNQIENCTVITWKKNDNGTHTFWGLPGL